jgi:phage recombination protein Bet
MTDQSVVVTIPERQPRSVLVDMSGRYGMEPAAFEATLRATVCKGNVSREEFAAFLLVAKEYGLNPMTKELYAFPAKGGGIQPIVSIDGWSRIINDHPMFDGMDFEDVREGEEIIAITCRMHRKDRSRSIEATEYMAECRRGTDVWKTWPRRMLRHKAMIQCARYAFGFSGIVEQDEYERQMTAHDVTPREAPNLAARLAAPAEAVTEGFTVHNGLDPDDHILDFDAAPPVSDAEAPAAVADEATQAGADAAEEDFPGDRPSDPKTPTLATDLIKWADDLIRDLPDLTDEQVAHIETDRRELAKFAVLKTQDLEKAKELEAAINKRKGG